ncbi:hypothetical protein KC343_g3521 [Hortaea werneckii]|uniref:Dynactin subunit 2 n=1 Tax=Hortaea werneckii TaxID=91943 RepID=A0A3M7FR03_HORWE|nr:hypothetical protein KC352_g11385 [Hortaea werneckii]KAI7564067.1 hypothetical protein KC317_g7304 [Hortaea werneckii]KAI7621950.1 hypothetical protein KC346_g3434 [Hortaea werneckii]KAI7632368.1 hypothetical protein KC343_g3521 [Hortaea werneckii]KAI7678478.1 hypothetical protein KC319_g3323 [Hortaea werneckii]
MTEPSRLAGLPGYDTAPDVYETPAADLTDSTSVATQQTSPRSPSESSATSDEDDEEGDEDEEEAFGVSRRRLYPSQARSRFASTSRQVEARNVDLSDRVDGRRRGYKVRRGVAAGEEEEEGLEARIARLRREIEECRAEAGQTGQGGGEQEGGEEGVESLSRLLSSVEMPRRQGTRSSQVPAKLTPTENDRGIARDTAEGDTTDEQMLGKVTDFDTRLSALEQALGLSSLDSTTSEGLTTPVLPSLTLLDQQLTALSTASSLTNLEAASTRLSKLKTEAQQLASREGDDDEGAAAAAAGGPATLHPEDQEKLQALYTLLPNLQTLAPTVPAILTRLRSLRTLHTTAANAGNSLDELEQKQTELEKELKAWREGLEKVEQAVAQADEANGRNGRVVEGWVKELEGRMKTLRA